MTIPTKKQRSTFAKEVEEGLTAFPKYLSSKYFYDAIGDRLFQEIMAMPSYYLTDCEYEVMETFKTELANLFDSDQGFDLIELGAGDGKKTKVVLEELIQQKISFEYLPIDISQNALNDLERTIRIEFPAVTIKPQQGSYFDILEELDSYTRRKKVIMVLGSNIGNLLHPQAISFLKNIQVAMGPNDLLFMGFDQKKNPEIILDAYNDKEGITARFNKNILTRINRELAADFNIDQFNHWETYDPETGTARSFLVSTCEQSVHINTLQQDIHFEAWESIHTEISQKYDDGIVAWLAEEAGLFIDQQFADSKQYYKNYIFKKK